MNEKTRNRVAVAALVVLAAVGGATAFVLGGDLRYESPVVESVESEFGAVGEERTALRTTVVVRNPDERALPARATVGYRVTLAGVAVASGETRGVRVPPGRSTVTVPGAFDNGKVPAWWVRHVNRGERSTMRIVPRVTVAGVVSRELAPREGTVETDLLGPLSGGGGPVALGNRTVLEVVDQRAIWGEATDARAPVRVAVTLRNVHDRPVRLDGTAYEIRLNGVTVGNGTTRDAIRLAPGETGRLTVHAAIDPARMERWWVTHLRADQTTRMNVTVDGVVEDDGERKRLPLAVYQRRAVLETDVLGTGGQNVTVLPAADEGPTFVEPTVEDTDSEWGEVDEETTAIETAVAVSNPNGEAFADLLELRVDARTTINDLTVARNRTTLGDLPRAGDAVVTSRMAHDDVPRWWARHLNRGERSTVRTTTAATADLAVTSFDVAVPERTSATETDLLGGLRNDSDQPVTGEGGRTLFVASETDASWGETTPDRAPLTVEVRAENRQPRTVTIRDVNYTVRLNGVPLADRTVEKTYRLAPLETRTLEFDLVLDNRRMADWWPTHVRNGETSTLTTMSYATVESGGDTQRVRLAFMDGNRTVTTDLLGGGSGNESAGDGTGDGAAGEGSGDGS